MKSVNFKGYRGDNYVSGGGHDGWIAGRVQDYTSSVSVQDFTQATIFWKCWGSPVPNEQRDLIQNLCRHLKGTAVLVQKEAIAMFAKVDDQLAELIKEGLNL
jgi:catalase